MNELSTSKSRWPMHLHETVATIENRTRQCLEGCAPGYPLVANTLLDLDKVKQIMLDSAAESFNARVDHYESQSRFTPSSLEDVIDETVTATLNLAPLKLAMGSRYREAEPAIGEALVAELRSILATRPKCQPSRPAPVLARTTDYRVKNPSRRNSRYIEIDQALRNISEALPKSHAEVFKLLDERKAPLPARKVFRDARGWLKGSILNSHDASIWLSLRWRQLNLPAFARGPKK
jgi:hypothetical protein